LVELIRPSISLSDAKPFTTLSCQRLLVFYHVKMQVLR
jgi:hypothetical protein